MEGKEGATEGEVQGTIPSEDKGASATSDAFESNSAQAEDPTMPRQTQTKPKRKPKAKAPATVPAETKEKKMKSATKKAAPAKKAAAKKATAKRTVATGSDRKSYKADMVIKITDQERADKMRADSRRRVSFKKIKAGMTVAKYIAAGGDRLDLNIMDKLGIVSVK